MGGIVFTRYSKIYVGPVTIRSVTHKAVYLVFPKNAGAPTLYFGTGWANTGSVIFGFGFSGPIWVNVGTKLAPAWRLYVAQ